MEPNHYNQWTPFRDLNHSKEDFELDLPGILHKEIAYSMQVGVDKLLGDVLTLIDTLGLPERQDTAIKTQIKKAYYERYNSTADRFMMLFPALESIKDPKSARSWTAIQRNQNESITGLCTEFPS